MKHTWCSVRRQRNRQQQPIICAREATSQNWPRRRIRHDASNGDRPPSAPISRKSRVAYAATFIRPVLFFVAMKVSTAVPFLSVVARID